MKKILPTIVSLLVCCFVSLFIAPPVFAAGSTLELRTATITVSSPANFAPDTTPTLTLNTRATLTQRFNKIVAKLQNQSTDPTAVIRSPQGVAIVSAPIKTGTTQLSVPLDKLTPGQYSLSINDQSSVSFTWGVLALNSDQDSYRLGETAYLQVASLSSTGHTLCNSNLKLTVNDREVALQNSQTCGANNVTDTPDYFAYYQIVGSGTHHLELTNLDNGYTLSDTFTVAQAPPFTIERQGATRINPFKSDYTMTMKVTANSDWSGTIQEQLPPGFTALSPTTWVADLVPGEEAIFTYTYRAPKLSPAIFQLGPLAVGDHRESRTWSLASDATFQMQTGYYVGDGVDNRAITGVGFQPELVLIKDDTGNGVDGVIWKSSSMSGETSALWAEAQSDIASDAIQSLDSDGFTLGTNSDVNGANIRLTWIAFTGSDCTSSGTFCVGNYTGDGTSSHAITTVGFQPNFVMVKRTGTAGGVFRTSSMSTNVGVNFAPNNEVTDGTLFQTLDSTGFTVGSSASVNTSTLTYRFIAFKTTTNAFAVGTFTGTGSSQSITVGFRPQYVMVKNANATTASQAGFNLTETSGDYTGMVGDTPNQTGWITSLDSNGFTVGTAAGANESGKTIYWYAFAGASSPAASGTYTMKVGTYTGNGTTQSLTGVGFAPDLVIIKDEAGANYGVFRTRLMKGDSTAYLSNAVANFAGGITSLDSDGFSLGADASVNTGSTTYHYQAFGNAWSPEDNTGSADFTIGAFTGSNGDSRNILRVPFQPDFVAIKNLNSAQSGTWRTSAHTGDSASFFGAIADTSDAIQAFNSDGFQVGTSARANQSTFLMQWFAFKASSTMVVNNYTGSGSTQNITSVGFSPNLLWVKNSGSAVNGVLRPSTLAGDSTHYFANTAAATDRLTALISTGFSVGGNQTETNTSSTTYRYAAWMINVAPNTPSLDSPTDTATNQSLTPALKTTTTDTSNDYLRYKIELCTNVGMTTGCQTFDQTSSQTGWSGQNTQTSTAYTSGTQATYTIQSALSAGTPYYWRSYAIDPGGTNTWSGTQTPRSFTTTTAPTAPTTPYAEGASNPTGIVDLTPEFSAIHNDSDGDSANYYEIEVNTQSDFLGTSMWDTGAVSMANLANAARSTDVSYAGTALSYNGTTYYWRIRFTDTFGVVGAWSATQNFSTNSPPATPSLDSPADTATGQSLTPALLTTGTDTHSDYLRYKIELCENLGMTTNCQTFDQTVSQTGWSGQNAQTSTAYTSGTQATYTVQSALANSFTYYWRSYAIDPGGTNSWSSTQTPRSFTTLSGGGGSSDFTFEGVSLEGININ